ncbi:hypothetical protein AB0J38_12590 [Streptomyces sp. NPDC050095]|uniref:hypothetical protein n=1 Tax=unclassified Streptomyces TaxID=2593676 RepID=UPI0034463389
MRVLALLELVFVVLALVGVGLLSVPLALILGGVLGVLAVERAQAAAPGPERKGVSS